MQVANHMVWIPNEILSGAQGYYVVKLALKKTKENSWEWGEGVDPHGGINKCPKIKCNLFACS
jgi:hypothetical protein